MRLSKSSVRKVGVGVIVLGGIVAFMGGAFLPSHAQQGGDKSAKLEPFVQTLSGSVVKIKMLPIPGGTVKINGKAVTVKPFYMASTETPWEAYDA